MLETVQTNFSRSSALKEIRSNTVDTELGVDKGLSNFFFFSNGRDPYLEEGINREIVVENIGKRREKKIQLRRQGQ